ncbi:MAG: CBS domain-containing protein [Methanomicrobiales archaeon]|nr:CBS domain-containing protein [Methanomicrobiales archaeon]MDI6875333.1 CBS domain-containing protein [Methanomicrobiales archaeon]
MDLSLIQREILITLITLYHHHSHAIKGEEIAEVLKRNPGTVRNQMQALKAIGLVDGVPGPKGGYVPTGLAYRELNLTNYEQEANVPIQRNGNPVQGVRVSEIDFTTLCHPDLCHADVKVIGSIRSLEIGERITIGPTPVNKLLIRGEIIGKDEVKQVLLVSISEMVSLPKKPIRHYMSSPLISLPIGATLEDAIRLFSLHRVHGAPVMDGDALKGIITLTDVADALRQGKAMDTSIREVMTTDVVSAPSSTRLFEVIKRFKEREIGRLIVTENDKPIGILTQTDIIRILPSL